MIRKWYVMQTISMLVCKLQVIWYVIHMYAICMYVIISIKVRLNKMNSSTIEYSLRNVNEKLMNELTEEEKNMAFKQFREHYAREMGKVVTQVNRKKKIANNLANLQSQDQKQAFRLNQSLSYKMKKHFTQREKFNENKIKEVKMMDEQWKNKIQQIINKKKIIDREAYRKSQQLRKKTQQFWTHKTQSQIEQYKQNPQQKLPSLSRTLLPNYSKAQIFVSKKRTLYTDLSKKTLQKSHSKSMISDKDVQIKKHIQLSNEKQRQRQQQIFQKAMQKLKKITQTRKNLKINLQKSLNNNKRQRQLKQLQKQQQQYKPIKKRLQIQIQKNNAKMNQPQITSKVSLIQHMNRKKQLEQQGFNFRGQILQGTLKRLKNNKIKKLVREAVSQLKFQTLKQ